MFAGSEPGMLDELFDRKGRPLFDQARPIPSAHSTTATSPSTSEHGSTAPVATPGRRSSCSWDWRGGIHNGQCCSPTIYGSRPTADK